MIRPGYSGSTSARRPEGNPWGPSVLRVICVAIALSYNRGCMIAQWLRRSLLRANGPGLAPLGFGPPAAVIIRARALGSSARDARLRVRAGAGPGPSPALATPAGPASWRTWPLAATASVGQWDLPQAGHGTPDPHPHRHPRFAGDRGWRSHPRIARAGDRGSESIPAAIPDLPGIGGPSPPPSPICQNRGSS